MEDLKTCILGHWTHSHEEDTAGVKVYRPADYNFPPSRGRAGFDFQEGGELIYYGIAATDGSEETFGTWTIEEPNRVKISVSNGRIQPFVLQVIACDEEILKVKP